MNYKDENFDIDLDFGEEFENKIVNIFEGDGSIEVKTEDVKHPTKNWKVTGNIAIEIRCKGKPSGLSTTGSSVWIHLLSKKGVIKGGFLFKVDELKGKIKKLHENGKLKMVMGGDDNASQMALLPIKELF